MGRRKDLTENEKSIITKEIAKGKTPKAIAEKIGRHVNHLREASIKC